MAGRKGSSETRTPIAVLDARGFHCPLPVLKARKKLAALPFGALLSVTATDPAARIDMAHFCAASGHALVSVEEEADILTFLIRKGGAA